MKRFISQRFGYVALAIATMLPTAAGHAQTCGGDACVSPCVGQEILYDASFINDCPNWVLSGYADRIYAGPGNGYYISMTAGSGLHQDVTPPSGSHTAHQIGLTVNIVNNGSPGTERLTLKVVRQSDGAVLEVVDSIFPSDSSGTYYYNIGDYSGQAVRIDASVNISPHTGDTDFQIQGLRWWETP